MSTVTVQLFASYADMLGGAKVDIPLSSGSTVRDLVNSLRSLPGAAALPASVLVAVNRKLAGRDQRIEPADEIALIPPMAGG